MSRPILACVVALCTALACRSNEPTPAPKPRPATPAKTAPVIAPPVAQPRVTKEQVTSVVERWRAAQVESNFDAYSALYAPTFHGIKRAGNKTSRFDRTGWMKDRREMFRRDMKVSVSDVRVFTGARSAFATFVQDWSTPRFHDVGPKRLEFALFAGKLLITSEEMLESTAAAVGVKAPAPEELSLLWPLRRGFGAVLKHGPIETRGVARKVVMSKDPSDFLLEKEVTEAATKPFESLRGRALDLYDANGVACSTSVTAFRAIGGFTTWDEREAADAVWEAIGEPYLVAVVEPVDPQCKTALWARASDLPKPTVLRPRELTPTESELARLALRKTTTSVATQASYAGYRTANNDAQAPPRWEALEPEEWGALAFVHPTTNQTYVAAELFAGPGCEAFTGYALGFFKVATPDWLDLTGNGNPMTLFPVRPLFGMRPVAAVALEPGGRLFMVGQDVIYTDSGAGFAPLLTIGRMRTTCSC